MLKSFIHDEKKHLSTIKSLSDSSEVREYIDKIYGEIKHHSMFGNTKNKMLDLVINKYNYICEKESMHVPIFLSLKSDVVTKEDLQLAENLLDTLIAHIEKAYDIFENKLDGVIKIAITNA